MVLKDPLSLGSFVRLLRRLRDALYALSHLSGSKGARFGTSHPFQSTCRPPGVGLSLARPGWALPSCPSPSAALRRRCGSRCPRPGSGPAEPARDEVYLPGRLSRPGRLSPACVFGRDSLACTAPVRPAPSPSRAQGSIRGRLAGVIEGARGPPDRSPPPGAPEVWISPWGHPVLSLSSGSRGVRAPAAAEAELAAPEPPAAHPLPPAAPPAPPRLRGGAAR